MSDASYAGDLTPEQAWEILKSETDAALIDVRTDAEFHYIGLADLSSLGKEPKLIQWKLFPAMNLNPDFDQQINSLGANPDTALLFLCRSGVRSLHSAIRMTEQGYNRCYNVSGGFEGDPDAKKHRGTTNGWKVAGLPWVQS